MGASCVPFSRSGLAQTFSDARADVFAKGIACILQQARRAPSRFRFFVLENVMGFNDSRGGGPSPCDEAIELLQAERPKGWELHLFKMSSEHVSLPQARDRLYLCGRLGFPKLEHWPSHLRFQGLPLEHVLDFHLPSEIDSLTPLMRSNLDFYKAEAHSTNVRLGTICVCDLTRSPDKVRPTMCKHDGIIPCLTARNRYLWAFELVSPYSTTPPRVDRFLSHAERCRCQGFSSDILLRLPTNKVVECTGNAMSVPCVGLVLCCILQGWRSV